MGKESKDELRKRLTEEQYRVVCENGTERAFKNEFWDHHAPGLYIDVASGEPLFSSTDKFDSGTGWPSFTRPVEPERVVQKEDNSYSMNRVEARSKDGDSHLGHVFDDGPAPTGKRYCINSAALRFIPADKLEAEGYGRFRHLFESKPAVKTQKATFAAGCFWGVEAAFAELPGVVSTRVGYTGGTVPDATYEQVCEGGTGHAEAVEVEFDPARLSYDALLDRFWKIHDPTQLNRQGPDVGSQYRSAVFAHDDAQLRAALASKEALARSLPKGTVATAIEPARPFYPAEEYHQKYFLKHGRTCHF